MKRILTDHISHSGMMYASDFKQWYTYLKRRLDNEWTTEELSFLLGKPSYYYTDFEKMYKVPNFLQKESTLLDRIYQRFECIPMEFDSKPYEGTEERLVRLTIEEESLWRCYRLTIPWEFKTEKGAPPVPSLYFEEWKKEGDILAESETLSHVRLELDKLFENNFFLIEQFPFELYTKIKKTELSHFCIMPRHIKQAVYLLIQQGKIVIRNKGGRYIFQQYK